MSSENLYRVKTFHGTQLFYSPEHEIIHVKTSEAPEIFAQFQDQALFLFAIVGGQKKYFYIDSDQKLSVASEPMPLEFERNADGSISITLNGNFLSARKRTGLFNLMPNNKNWEHLTLEPISISEMTFEELSKSFALVSNIEREIPPVSRELCAGCTACAMVCPKGALTMVEDDEGFLQPTLDPELCINCGRCEWVCPIKNPKKNPAPEIGYATWINDEERRMKSSSGGLAYALSKAVIERGGVVCGAALEGFVVKHILVDNVDDLSRLQGTKYVQSDLGDNFIEIKKLLKSGREVLFTGTPCQVAGLKNFMRGFDENLLTIDVVCHGVPSPGVLRRYIEELKQCYPTAVTMSFRDKFYGWNPHHAIALYDTNLHRVFRESGKHNAYIKGFLKNVFCRRSCANCSFASKERVGDITLSDYWGITQLFPELNDKKGISLTVPNTDKGRSFFESIKESLEMIRETPYAFAVANQGQLRKPGKISAYRKKFFQWMSEGRSIEYFLERFMFQIGILNFHFANSFGALLVSYALQRAIKSLGYTSENINYVVERPEMSAFSEFRNKFIKTSATPLNKIQLKSKNLYWKRIVVGSDQVWKMFNTGVYMCDWASGKKSLISYAASFGHDVYSGRIPSERAQKLLSRFDFISVREESGVDICKKEFGVEAVHVIDPTLLLTRNHYEKMIDPNSVMIPDKPYAVVAFINKTKTYIPTDETLLTDFRDKYAVWDPIADENGVRHSMSTWLASIRDAEFIITDSFHVTAFSILFNKQFVSIVRANGLARIPSLLKQCGIPSTRIYKSIKNVSLESFEEKIDYGIVNKLVEKEREKGFMFLKMALAAPPNYKQPV